METTEEIWVAACAHALQRHWRSVDPEQLAEVATDLWRNETMRVMAPAKAAVVWLEPVASAQE